MSITVLLTLALLRPGTPAMTTGYSLHIPCVHIIPWIMADVVAWRCTFESFTSCCSTSRLWELWNGSQFPMLNIGNWGTTRWDGWFLSPLCQNRQKWPTHCQLRVFYQTFSCKGRVHQEPLQKLPSLAWAVYSMKILGYNCYFNIYTTGNIIYPTKILRDISCHHSMK